MTLTGEQFGELTAILVEVFDASSLGLLVRVRFNTDLADEVPVTGVPFRDTASALVRWLEQRGRTAEFVGYLRAERPTSDRVRRFYESYLAATTADSPGGPTGLPPDLGRARDKVIEFKVYFRESETQFRYLNAFKDLHDKLHDLHEMRTGIDLAVDQFRRRPDDPVGLEIVAEDLQALAREARRAADNLEEPADAVWIDPFARAVDGLTRCLRPPDLMLLDQSVKVLRELPAQHQAGLNADLVRTAKRLKSERLAKTAGEILGVLAEAGSATPLLAEFRTRLGGFGGLCDRLVGLIRQHDDCQVVEVTLAPFEAVREVSPDRIPGWAGAADRLQRVAAARPDDPRAKTTGTAAATFAAVRDRPGGDLFDGLLVRFRRLFNELDKELLAVTDDLVREAQLLAVQLRTLTNVPD